MISAWRSLLSGKQHNINPFNLYLIFRIQPNKTQTAWFVVIRTSLLQLSYESVNWLSSTDYWRKNLVISNFVIMKILIKDLKQTTITRYWLCTCVIIFCTFHCCPLENNNMNWISSAYIWRTLMKTANFFPIFIWN